MVKNLGDGDGSFELMMSTIMTGHTDRSGAVQHTRRRPPLHWRRPGVRPPLTVVKRGIVWRSFAGLSGVVEVERNAFANSPNAVTCTYIFWRCQNYAI